MLRQAGWVDEGPSHRVDPLVQPIDQSAFVVRLENLEADAQFARERMQAFVDLGESRRAVDVRFAPAEQVEVRPVQDEELFVGHEHDRRIDWKVFPRWKTPTNPRIMKVHDDST